jgi:Cytosol aminopeptidase family, N-terminal domain
VIEPEVPTAVEVDDRSALDVGATAVAVPVSGAGGIERALLVGVGDGSAAMYRRAGAAVARSARGVKRLASMVSAIASDAEVRAFVEGAVLAPYALRRSEGSTAPLRELVLASTGHPRAEAVGRGRAVAVARGRVDRGRRSSGGAVVADASRRRLPRVAGIRRRRRGARRDQEDGWRLHHRRPVPPTVRRRGAVGSSRHRRPWPGRRRRARGRQGWPAFGTRALLYWLETARPVDLATR